MGLDGTSNLPRGYATRARPWCCAGWAPLRRVLAFSGSAECEGTHDGRLDEQADEDCQRHDIRIPLRLSEAGRRVRRSAPDDRLRAVLRAYALTVGERPHGSELGALLHRDEHVARAHQELNDLVRDLIADAVEAGDVRDDVPADELARCCIHAVAVAAAAGRAAVLTTMRLA
ncbi:MAG: hypothetical protein ACRDNL_18020 [Spirillospora sp.]